tara:strand:- start:483 stop:746 length:264 start_codon:yes stop_codon:yes gene_type:complete
MNVLRYDCDYHEVCILENIWRSSVLEIYYHMNLKRVLLLHVKHLPSDCMKIIFDFLDLPLSLCKRVHGIKKIGNGTFAITDETASLQ